MSSNPHRDLASIARDVRLTGLERIPINIERSCMIFVKPNAYHTNASYFSAIRVAKLARWAKCEVYFMTDPTIQEFTNTVHHFATQSLNFCLFYVAGNPITQDVEDPSPVISFPAGTVGPDLVYTMLNEKRSNSRIVWMMDGCQVPEAWDPLEQELDEAGILFIAPFPDDSQAHLEQLDLKGESIFVKEVCSALKAAPKLTAEKVEEEVEPGLVEFGQKVFCASYPEEFKTHVPMIV